MELEVVIDIPIIMSVGWKETIFLIERAFSFLR